MPELEDSIEQDCSWSYCCIAWLTGHHSWVIIFYEPSIMSHYLYVIFEWISWIFFRKLKNILTTAITVLQYGRSMQEYVIRLTHHVLMVSRPDLIIFFNTFTIRLLYKGSLQILKPILKEFWSTSTVENFRKLS